MGVEDVLRMHIIIDEVYKNLMEWGMIGLQRTVSLRNNPRHLLYLRATTCICFPSKLRPIGIPHRNQKSVKGQIKGKSVKLERVRSYPCCLDPVTKSMALYLDSSN